MFIVGKSGKTSARRHVRCQKAGMFHERTETKRTQTVFRCAIIILIPLTEAYAMPTLRTYSSDSISSHPPVISRTTPFPLQLSHALLLPPHHLAPPHIVLHHVYLPPQTHQTKPNKTERTSSSPHSKYKRQPSILHKHSTDNNQVRNTTTRGKTNSLPGASPSDHENY